MSAIVQSEAQRLRQAFDLSFALPSAGAAQDLEDLLTIRVAGAPWAVRLCDIAGLVAGARVIPLPADTLHLLGLVGLRGDVVPVFGLASILGYGQAAAAEEWLLICGAGDPIALAFSDFEGHVRLPRSSLQADVATTAAGARPVIKLPLIVATLRSQTRGP